MTAYKDEPEGQLKFNLAQINIGKMLAPLDSPVMAEFAANLDNINALAEGSNGFVWRLKDENNDATSIKVYDDDFIIINMSVWESIDALKAFVYQTPHVDIFKKRKQWFERLTDMHMALWYIPDGVLPTAREGADKLDYLRAHGETPRAFSFKSGFTAEQFVDFERKSLIQE